MSPSSQRASRAAKGSSKKNGTKCELLLRAALRQLGLRFNADQASLPGRPDIVFRNARVVVFCDGDFWHGRDLRPRLASLAKGHNAAYWVAKIRANVARDRRNSTVLSERGWLVLRVWETDIGRDAVKVAHRVAAILAVRAERRSAGLRAKHST
jgi:DNA mismatch endonuclease (patch repair protein)